MSGFKDFDEDFEKAPEKPKYANEATIKLPDGEYEVSVIAGAMKDGEWGPIVTFVMTVISECPQKGWKIEKSLWLTKAAVGGGREKDERRMTDLKGDLSTMGFDVVNWTAANNRKFAAQLEIACTVMKGVKLKIKKKQNDEHANIYINKRLEDGKPAKFGAAEMVAPPTDANGFGASPLGESVGAVDNSSIPF